jgi:double-strand break repair protein MRE11
VAIRKAPSTEEQKWFNIFVLHQNRAAHRTDEYVPESFLPKSMDLIVWGHEHECRLKPEFNEQQAFYVTQPGKIQTII